ncbi:DUF1848 domain-containing protein [Wukongibacter baidiensis]|uniref:DUF1848 domain-containing protein n=1 Tax=Wukongibacter baidiensis TaxID=1723361 RepID=UPI003D80015B
MIISASRRTDIPAYYSDWFIRRLKEKYVLVRNPMNYNQVSEVSLDRETLECIVFWTKNPYPILKYIDLLEDYNYYFQFTLTSYDHQIERGLPPKSKLVPIFKKLSSMIGKEKVIWRYDPILLSDNICLEDHFEKFNLLASKLKNSTQKCVISFLDIYPKISKGIQSENTRALEHHEMISIAKTFSEIAKSYSLDIETCSEKINLEEFGIKHSKCIDDGLIKRLFNYSGMGPKDSNQRSECGCVKSVDIGAYNTCSNGCVYCYANSQKNIKSKQHIDSPFITGELDQNDKVIKRKIDMVFSNQIELMI